MRYRHAMWVALAVAFTPSPASSVEGAKAKHKKPAAAAHSTKHRHSTVAARQGYWGQNVVRPGPFYNGQDYLGDDPDPNIRSQIQRDLGGRYGGND
jgi:hypothetical protein